MKRNLKALVLASVAFLAVSSAGAQTYHAWPESSGACSTTLQACINAAAPGDGVVIGEDDPLADGYTAVNESILINKSLTLTAAAGVDAVFAPGDSITIVSPATGAMTVDLSRVTLRHGHVRVAHSSDTESTYFLSRIRMDESDAGAADCAIRFVDTGSGIAHFILGDSDLRFREAAPARGGVCTEDAGGTRYVDYFRNRVRVENGSLLRAMTVGGTGAGGITIANNTVTGSRYASGISISQNPGSPSNTIDVLSNTVMGQASAGTEAAIRVAISQSTLRLDNNTAVYNQLGMLVSRFGADSSSARVANNLVAFNATSDLAIYDEAGGWIGNDYNLVHGNGADAFTPGPNTRTDDPMLVSRWDPRPRSVSSPLVDHGNNADVPVSPFGVGFDADGEPRIIASIVDIGAYELQLDLGGFHRSSASNTPGDFTDLDESIWNALTPGQSLFVTPLNDAAASAEMAYNLGVFQDDGSPSHWSIYHENLAPMSAGRTFSVFRPLEGRSFFLHTTSAANVFGQYTRLDDPLLDGQRFAYALVSHVWNPGGGTGSYHDHRVGLEYTGGHWQIRNEDAADMPLGISFNVMIPSFDTPNAFVAGVGPAARSALRLEHRLLDDNPCAAPQVTRVDNPYDALITTDDVPYALAYQNGTAGAPGHWYLYASGGAGSAFFANAEFNVMVYGPQANACADDDRIFADSFDG